MIRRSLAFALALLLAATAVSAADRPDQIDNLSAFTRLYGYLRFFHPSDEAQEVDWDRLAVLGARRTLNAGSPEELRDLLLGLFGPIAPTVQIYLDGEVVAAVPTFEGPVVAWQHKGVYLAEAGLYASTRSHRVHRVPAPGSRFANIMRSLLADPYRGRNLRLSFLARADDGSRGQGWLRVDRPQRLVGYFDNMQDRPVTAAEWRRHVIEGKVAEDAINISFGFLMTRGDGSSVDSFRLEVDGGGGWRTVELDNTSFEADGLEPWSVVSEGWDYGHERADAPDGSRFVQLLRRFVEVEPFSDRVPAAGDSFDKPLGRGLRCRVPLALPAARALEQTDRLRALQQQLEAIDLDAFDATDVGFRVGNVVQLWTLFQHFYPYFDQVATDWAAVLGRALDQSLEDRDRADHHRTLLQLMAQLEDGHAHVFDALGERGLRNLPLVLDWVEERIVVAHADPASGITPGDVLVSIGGKPALQRLQDDMAVRSGSPRWIRRRSLAEILRGREGESVHLSLIGEDREPFDIELAFDTRFPRRPQRPAIERLDGGAYYVDLRQASWEEIEGELVALAAAPGVVFDLRGYPNGNHMILQHLTDEPLQSARWNVPLQIRPDQEDPVWDTSGRWLLEPADPRFRGPVVFLTDGSAISYAESVMAIVAHYELGEIIGEATAGTNGNVNPFSLPGDFRVNWTGMLVTRHDGSQHHLRGVTPTVPAAPTIAGVRAGRDEVLERGLAVLATAIAAADGD